MIDHFAVVFEPKLRILCARNLKNDLNVAAGERANFTRADRLDERQLANVDLLCV